MLKLPALRIDVCGYSSHGLFSTKVFPSHWDCLNASGILSVIFLLVIPISNASMFQIYIPSIWYNAPFQNFCPLYSAQFHYHSWLHALTTPFSSTKLGTYNFRAPLNILRKRCLLPFVLVFNKEYHETRNSWQKWIWNWIYHSFNYSTRLT